MQSGQLIVTGNSEVAISLRGVPSKVIVNFEDDCVVLPCNPKHFDELQWEVLEGHEHCHHHGSDFELLIGWEVSGVREIKWTVYY